MRILVVLPLLLLAGCSLWPGRTGLPPATLADLQPVALPAVGEPLPGVSPAELAAIYLQVLETSSDPQTRLQVQHRLADLELLAAETELLTAETEPAIFAPAVAAYETLLRENPDYPLGDRLLYQLSRALELSGDNAASLSVLERIGASHPQSVHLPEAEFRKAEIYYAGAEYGRAAVAYETVIARGQHTAYYTQSLYMLGWALFKQGRYQPAVAAFTATLDQLMPADGELGALSRSEQELAQDSFRVLAVAFSYQQGADTIASAYDELGVRPYQHLIYQQLGDLYLQQQRYRDSAETYRAYTRRQPDSSRAHQFQLWVIAAYEAGGFSAEVVSEKRHYVDAFAVSGRYWQRSDVEAQAAMQPQLQLFIAELASYHHALAQEADSESDGTELAVGHYRSAADYYQLYIDSFPADPELAAMGFLLGESRYEAGEMREAVTAWNRVAYQYSSHPQAADAGYAAILALAEWEGSNSAATLRALQRERSDCELLFALTFAADPRAPAVLAHASRSLLEQGEYQQAIIAAAGLLGWQPDPGATLAAPAWLVIGQSHFALQQYAGAEEAFTSALQLLPARGKRRTETVDQLAASVYRQGEQAEAAGEYLQAAQQYDRVSTLAPLSGFTVTARFDAADNYLRAGELQMANERLLDFRRRYPGHPLAQSVGARLVANYEQLEQWDVAAAELDVMTAAAVDDRQQREALYLAARYYDRAGAGEQAIARFRRYALDWPEPLAPRMEAMNRLARLYELAGQAQKRRFWLRKIMVAHDESAREQSDRSLFLAAMSAAELGDYAYREFRGIKLGYPLSRSLARKKTAMERALFAYEQTNAYGVQQFSTLATYRMGRIYQTLSLDLMRSERPGNIDALALEQYELLLEEQAYPFEEKAIAIYEANARRSRNGVYDRWVMESFVALAELEPARYGKAELRVAPGEEFYPSLALALRHQQRHETDRAEHWFLESLTGSNGNASAHSQYGVFLREQGRFEEAEQAYLDALGVWRDHPDTHRNIGILYDLYLGQQDKALQHFQRYQGLTGETDRTVAGWIAELERRQTRSQGQH